MPDFGPDGMAGLGFDKRQELIRGEIIHPKSLTQTANGKTMIEAALASVKKYVDSGGVWSKDSS